MWDCLFRYLVVKLLIRRWSLLTLRQSSVNIKLCQHSSKLMLQYLHKSESTTMLGIINEHINFQGRTACLYVHMSWRAFCNGLYLSAMCYSLSSISWHFS
ncbi:hypothetical protein HS088_TW09G01428 [Tripterygium wilfordii]|uniref:TFIID subunit TAF5 NTD2 domain-containing protein n=1 Tax=Tripterygium wilfordii TaxID=458696 RepID=A0A7J7DAI4_TRIWF|nr:hypothetical protein HS088_TW09G01428 [Tripterygium wilfordii]